MLVPRRALRWLVGLASATLPLLCAIALVLGVGGLLLGSSRVSKSPTSELSPLMTRTCSISTLLYRPATARRPGWLGRHAPWVPQHHLNSLSQRSALRPCLVSS